MYFHKEPQASQCKGSHSLLIPGLVPNDATKSKKIKPVKKAFQVHLLGKAIKPNQ
jgi:hypothetical protein